MDAAEADFEVAAATLHTNFIATVSLNVFLEGLRNRIDRDGVQVLTIKPGFVATPMTAHVPHNALFASPDQVAQGILKAIERRVEKHCGRFVA